MDDVEFTVFAVYEENLQPYCTTIAAATPQEAVLLAQQQCVVDNDPTGPGYPEPAVADIGAGWMKAVGDFGAYTLTAFQVVRGRVEVVL
jgi:hypothetical protein